MAATATANTADRGVVTGPVASDEAVMNEVGPAGVRLLESLAGEQYSDETRRLAREALRGSGRRTQKRPRHLKAG